ncbi:transcriptional regulator [Natrinema sp. 1APR25-10V2]|uniref:helix-turn-helix transcriptional regulator n=1 Tax=Natrinema sp. 1APR25-10V2 TaxID=2951081 RepID=UPI0028748282|nr:transcriptional regulator [Natrinema sp. 1APR25-10V2]MDS0476883.1 transcriptional regulator [Natrinema sp. 1APR25-10V2]
MASHCHALPTNMDSALDAIQFFADSANSVHVFEALTAGSTTSRDLTEQTGASRSTVARILDKGESRGWITSEGSQYELTEEGEIMTAEFRTYLQTVEGIQHLGDAIEWLPAPVHSLDYRHFRTADLITPKTPTPSRPYDHVAEKIRSTDEVRSLVEVTLPRYVTLIHDQVNERQLDTELVIDADWIETLPAESEQLPLLRARAERDSIWTCDGGVPLNMHLFDDSVAIWLGEDRDEERVVRGLLVVEVPAVLSWAEGLYEDYRNEGELLDPATVSAR